MKRIINGSQKVIINGNNFGTILQIQKISGEGIVLPLACEPINNYLGHKNEKKVIDDFFENDIRSVIISGIGGIGKSEFARYYCDSREGVNCYWLDFKKTFINTLVDATSIKAVQDYGSDEKNLLTILVTLINKSLSKNDIIVFDNVDDFSDLNYINQLCCYKIFTTRRNVEINYNKCTVYEFPPVSIEEGTLMFNQYYYEQTGEYIEKSEECYLQDIITIIGCHTLTIELLAKTVANGDITVEELLNKLKKSGFCIKDLPGKISQNNTDMALPYFNHIIKLLDFKTLEKTENAKQFLVKISYLSMNDVEIEFLRSILKTDNNNIFHELSKFGYIKIKNNRVFMHNLIADLIRYKYANLHYYTSSLIKDLFLLYKKSNDRRYMNQMINVSKHLKNGKVFYWTSYEISGYYFDQGYWKDAQALCYDILNRIKHFPCINRLLFVKILLRTSRIEKALGLYESANKYCDTASSLLKKSILGKHIEKKKLASEVYLIKAIILYQYKQDYSHVISLLEEALTLLNVYTNTDEVVDLLSEIYSFLGLSYRGKEDYKKAMDYLLNKTLVLLRKKYSEDSFYIAETKNNIAGVYRKMKQYEEAIKWYKEALYSRKKFLYHLHPDIISNLNNLGLCYSDCGKNQVSLKYLENSINAYKKIFDNDHPYLAACYHNIAGTFMNIHNYTKAIDYYKESLRIKHLKYGDTDQRALLDIKCLVDAYYLANNSEKAKEYCSLLQENASPDNWILLEATETYPELFK